MKIFGPDNHSPDCADFFAPPLAISSVWEKAAEIFKVESKNIQLVGGANLNSLNFKSGSTFLKVIENDPGRLQKLENFPHIVERLKDFGIPTADFLLSSHGKKIETFTALGKEYLAYAQPFLCADFYSGEESELIEMFSIIKNLANCSPSLVNYVHERLDPEVDYRALFQKVFDLTSSKKEKTEFDQTFLENSADISNSLLVHAKYEGSEPDGVFHCDLHPHNILAKNGKVKSIIDLDSFYLAKRKTFVGFSLFKLSRKSISKGLLSASEIQKLLSREFPQAEQNLNGANAEIFRRLFSVLDLHYFSNDYRYDGDLTKQICSLKEAKEIFSY